MKAAIRRQYCQPSELKVEETPEPIPKKGQILVRVRTTTVNRTDCANLNAKPFIMRFFIGLIRPKLVIPGTDFAGEVVSLGEGAQRFQVGDRVFGFLDGGLSSQAELMSIAESLPIAKMSPGMSFEDAAASIEGAHYAINMLNKTSIKKEDAVLINGSTGAIGSALLQIVKSYGCKVTAVCNTKNIERIKSLGADKIFDYQTEDFTRDDEQYDFVFDAVGKSSFGKCKNILKKGGVYISSELGPGLENLYLPLLTKFFASKKVVFPVPLDVPKSIEIVKGLYEAKKYVPVIDRTYPLDEASDAYCYAASGEKTGNIVLVMTE